MCDANGWSVLASYMQYVVMKIRSIMAMAKMSGSHASQVTSNVRCPLAERSPIARVKSPASPTTSGVAERMSAGSSWLSFWEGRPDDARICAVINQS